jgi:hypothetical protein
VAQQAGDDLSRVEIVVGDEYARARRDPQRRTRLLAERKRDHA